MKWYRQVFGKLNREGAVCVLSMRWVSASLLTPHWDYLYKEKPHNACLFSPDVYHAQSNTAAIVMNRSKSIKCLYPSECLVMIYSSKCENLWKKFLHLLMSDLLRMPLMCTLDYITLIDLAQFHVHIFGQRLPTGPKMRKEELLLNQVGNILLSVT